MVCGPSHLSCERWMCGSSRTGAPALGSEVALQEWSLTQQPEEPRRVCHRLQHHGAAWWPAGSHSHTEQGRCRTSEHSGSALGNSGTNPWPWHHNRNPAAVSRWSWAGACGGQREPGLTPVRGSGDVGTHREGRRQGRGDKEEREPNWELLPLLGDMVAAGNNPQQHLRPGQANLRLRVAQKWYLWSTLNPKLFYALLQGKGA